MFFEVRPISDAAGPTPNQPAGIALPVLRTVRVSAHVISAERLYRRSISLFIAFR